MANKHCKKFEEHNDYINAMNSNKLSIHTVSYCKEEKDFHYDNDMFQLECIFNVTDISQATKILNNPDSPVINLIEVDGIKLNNVVSTYLFSSTGHHIVRYSLNTLPSIGNNNNYWSVFSGVTNLISFKCNDDITTFARGIFKGTGITNINITKNIIRIITDYNGGTPFSGCDLNNITVDPSNPIYDSRDNCNAIIETSTNKLIIGGKNTVIPNTVTIIGNHAFSFLLTIYTIVIPDTVTTILRSGLRNAPLQYINIPATLTDLAVDNTELCFNNTVLENITVDPSNPVYDSRDNCNALIITSTNTLIMGSKNTVIPNTVTAILSIAFRNPEITSIFIPTNVTDIHVNFGSSAFSGCFGLETVIFDSITPPNINILAYGYLFTPVANPNLTNIYVPDESVETYKTLFTTKAPDFVNYVKGISTMP